MIIMIIMVIISYHRYCHDYCYDYCYDHCYDYCVAVCLCISCYGVLKQTCSVFVRSPCTLGATQRDPHTQKSELIN